MAEAEEDSEVEEGSGVEVASEAVAEVSVEASEAASGAEEAVIEETEAITGVIEETEDTHSRLHLFCRINGSRILCQCIPETYLWCYKISDAVQLPLQ